MQPSVIVFFSSDIKYIIRLNIKYYSDMKHAVSELNFKTWRINNETKTKHDRPDLVLGFKYTTLYVNLHAILGIVSS
jgi:hypothetical protein